MCVIVQCSVNLYNQYQSFECPCDAVDKKELLVLSKFHYQVDLGCMWIATNPSTCKYHIKPFYHPIFVH